MKKRRSFEFSWHSLSLVLLAIVFLGNIYRAATQSITHDEALTYRLYINKPLDVIFTDFNANHHVLHTILCKISVKCFGVSEFSLRVPCLLGGLLYFVIVYLLADRLFGETWHHLLAVAALGLNPYLLDYLSIARGYGLAVAFFFAAFYLLLVALDDRANRSRFWLAGMCLGFSVASNLTLLFPSVGLITLFGLVLLLDLEKGKKSRNTHKILARLIFPFLGTASAILLPPLLDIQLGEFYYGAVYLWHTCASLLRFSFEYPGSPEAYAGIRALIADWIVLALLLFLGLLALKPFIDRKKISPANRALLLSTGTLMVTLVLLILAHALFQMPYPLGRTGLYWIPLLTLAVLAAIPVSSHLGPVFAVILAACVVRYITEWNVRFYADWIYDFSTKEIVRHIETDHTRSAKKIATIGGSWQFEPSLNFYRVKNRDDWMDKIHRNKPDSPYDYYVLLDKDESTIKKLGLRILYRDTTAGAILAIPQ